MPCDYPVAMTLEHIWWLMLPSKTYKQSQELVLVYGVGEFLQSVLKRVTNEIYGKY